MSKCSIQYSSSETNFSGKLTIGNTKHCQILYTGVDNDKYNDNTDDNTVPELITSEYGIKAYDIDYSDVAAVVSVANITVINTTSPSNTSNSPSIEPSDNTTNIEGVIKIITNMNDSHNYTMYNINISVLIQYREILIFGQLIWYNYKHNP